MREMLVKSARNRYQSKVLATAVFLPVMPIGVEQGIVPSSRHSPKAVFLPVMPIGVEQSPYWAFAWQIWRCVLTCDADRR